MSRARKQVFQEIVDALQGRIAQWQAERARIDIMRARQDRKVERYQILADLIAEAEAEIARASARISTEAIGANDETR